MSEVGEQMDSGNLTSNERKLLSDYCRIFDINEDYISENRKHAFGILSAMYAYPNIRDSHERKRNRDGVLAETARVWGQDSRFFGAVSRVVALSLHDAEYFVQRTKSNEELITEFRYLLVAVIALEIIGIGGIGRAISGSFSAGAAKTIKDNSVRAGLEAAKQRLMLGGGSAVVEAAAIRWGAALGLWSAAFVAILIVAHTVMVRNMEEIRAEITERHGDDKATDDDLESVQNRSFSEIVQEQLAQYW